MALVEHCQAHGHRLCDCGSPHYPHRPGTAYCVKNPMAPLQMAIRAGNCTDEELLEIQLDCALYSPGRPFTTWRD